MHRLIIYIFICLIIFIGCNEQRTISPVDNFRIKNPELSRKYIALYPTSCKVIGDSINFTYTMQRGLIENLKGNFSNCSSLVNYLSELEKKEIIDVNEKLSDLDKFRSLLSENDFLFEFEYKDGEIEETGIIVINDGEIRLKRIYTTTNLWDSE